MPGGRYQDQQEGDSAEHVQIADQAHQAAMFENNLNTHEGQFLEADIPAEDVINEILDEEASGEVNGVNDEFTLKNEPDPDGAVEGTLVASGTTTRLIEGRHFTRVGSVLTLGTPPAAGEVPLWDYENIEAKGQSVTIPHSLGKVPGKCWITDKPDFADVRTVKATNQSITLAATKPVKIKFFIEP